MEPDIDKPLTDLEALLAALAPRHNPGEYAVVSVREVPTDVHPVLTFFEQEGLTLILPLGRRRRSRGWTSRSRWRGSPSVPTVR